MQTDRRMPHSVSTSWFNYYRGCLLAGFALLVGCGGGGGSGSGSDAGEPLSNLGDDGNVAYLLDAAVEGLVYRGNGVDGETSSDGGFRFRPGEPVNFSFAGMDVGTVTVNEAGAIVTPAELQNVDRNDFATDTATVNLLRLLQTMDLDGDPTNGIQLPDQSTLSDSGLENVLSDIQLGDPSFDSQIASRLVDIGLNLGTREDLISAQQAIEHFELTLESIVDPANEGSTLLIGLAGASQWQWDVYGGEFGEWGSRIVFNEDGTGKLVEYGDCAGSDENAWIGTYERAMQVCAEDRSADIRWTVEGNNIQIDTGSFIDTCRVLTGNKNHFTASCRVFLGEGQFATETQYFVRAGVNGFYPELLEGNHIEPSATGINTPEDITVFEIEQSGTGTYKAGSEPEERYSWSIENENLDWILDVEGEGILDPIRFRNYVAGAHEIGETDASANRTVLIPDYRGWGGDQIDVIRYSLTDPGSGYLLSGSPEDGIFGDGGQICEVEGGIGEVCLIENGADRVCSPIHRIPSSDGRGIYWMNCRPAVEASSGVVSSFEIWRRRL